MSIGADPQMTLRDYFTRHNGKCHTLVANIAINGQIEFYVCPEGMEEEDGMHFTVNSDGKISEIGVWEPTEEEIEKEVESNNVGL